MTRRLVIIEDDQWLSESYSRIARAAGYEVFAASDADRAIDVIDAHQPDVIMLDMLLRRTTGMALLHELQSHVDLARIPVVIVSSMADRLEQEKLIHYGVRQVLDKESVTPQEMLQVVSEAIG